jgi:hypothetical protein
MGHERIGYLPKSKKWNSVVSEVSSYDGGKEAVSKISNLTLKNVRYKFNDITTDTGVKSAFEFLILLTLIPKKKDWREFLDKKGIHLEEKFNLLTLANSAKNYVKNHEDSNEYSAVAIQSLVDAIAVWTNNINQGNLFASHDSQVELWKSSSTGSGFCELSRLFFSKFTERYLRYFLEREAFGRITNLTDLNNFSKSLERHVDDISIHAFETAKITQSFAAGWYNKNVKSSLPSQALIKSFIGYSFKKLNSEIMNEQISE